MNKFDYLSYEATLLMNDVMKCMTEDLRNDWKNRKEYLKSKNSMESVEDIYLYFLELCDLSVEDLSSFYNDFKRIRSRYIEIYDENLPEILEYSRTMKSNN